eukprot:TRINITY_DN1343_c1_g1_i1.p1 TRINITY_DN1343_c1_g1~~TRINITY_DN1343_c1_g1_i1.p1  ORF type:complete len:137 (+),score=40.75 TRINITY_DN1343_c1_g1_i1:754-1164(+)
MFRMFLNGFLKFVKVRYEHLCKNQPFFKGSPPLVGRSFMAEACLQHSRSYIEYAKIEDIVPYLQRASPIYATLFEGKEFQTTALFVPWEPQVKISKFLSSAASSIKSLFSKEKQDQEKEGEKLGQWVEMSDIEDTE